MYQCPSDSIAYRAYVQDWYIRSYALTQGKNDENYDKRFVGIFGLGTSKNWAMDPSQIRSLSKTVLGMEYWTKQNFLGSTTDSLALYWTDFVPLATHPGETLNYLFADSHVERLKKDVVYNNASPTWIDYTDTLFDCRR
jgi:prepilin-type processing-associated H-X9-DG protein